MKSFVVKNNLLHITWGCSGQEWQNTLALVKSLEGRLFNPKTKSWSAIASEKNIKTLLDGGFTSQDTSFEPIPKIAPKKIIDKSKLPKGIYPYQIEGVEFLENRDGCGLIGDPTGLGKSIQSIAYSSLHPEIKRILVICPSVVKINWMREIRKWVNEDSQILFGKTPYFIGDRYRWTIINYDILSMWLSELLAHNFDMFIADEAHSIKNPTAKRTKAFLSLAKTIKRKVFLSATPIKNAPSEFYNILHELDPINFANRWYYLNRYCDPQYGYIGRTFKGLTNGEELFAKIKPLMIRREKAEVLKELPIKQKIVVPMPMSDSAMVKYNKASEEFKTWAKSTQIKKSLDGKKHIELLRQIAYLGKRNSVIQWIENFLESGEKLIIFAWHKTAIDDIHNAFKDISVVVDGRVSPKEKQQAVDDFQNKKEVLLFIGNIQAAGVGITLTAASNMAIIEFPWSPGDLEQAEGRHHRIGQLADSVSVYYLVGAGTVDEDTAILLDTKSKILDRTLDGKINGDIFGTDIADMLVQMIRSK
jgi:SWI/SNF-related matrix-associated actin-dependent regulator 1 of chromatin subfamily A